MLCEIACEPRRALNLTPRRFCGHFLCWLLLRPRLRCGFRDLLRLDGLLRFRRLALGNLRTLTGLGFLARRFPDSDGVELPRVRGERFVMFFRHGRVWKYAAECFRL